MQKYFYCMKQMRILSASLQFALLNRADINLVTYCSVRHVALYTYLQSSALRRVPVITPYQVHTHKANKILWHEETAKHF